jgi:RNA polymerase sigma-70 factor (ECF subfamily)
LTAQVVTLRAPARSSPAWSDEAVALACKSGDPEAVAELFDRFHERVMRYLSRVVSASADVEDLVQTTFLEIAKGNAHFSGRSSVRSWLFGIATNVARHHFRAQTRRKNLTLALSMLGMGRPAETVGALVDARSALETVQRTLDALPENLRIAFVLCEIEGFSAREAADALGVNETAVWKRVSDARKALVRALEEADR